MLSERAIAIADAAIAVLAESGSRALTHRAVDERAGLPAGATSNIARTRAALLELTLTRVAELDFEAYAAVDALRPAGSAGATDVLAEVLATAFHKVLTVHRARTVARYELVLESTRRPDLRAHFDRAGRVLRDHARDVIVALGSDEPDRHTRQVLALLEGFVFTTSIDGQPTPSHEDLVRTFSEFFTGMLHRP